MSGALPGSHYCVDHQGNHSHYDKSNCTVCKLEGGDLRKEYLTVLKDRDAQYLKFDEERLAFQVRISELTGEIRVLKCKLN